MKRYAHMLTAAIATISSISWSGEVPLSALFSTIKEPSQVVGLTYPDQESIIFLKQVLDVMGSTYATEPAADSTTVYWIPATIEQQQDVQNRVSQFDFVRAICPGLKTPLPSDAAKTKLQCED